jgi:hypothetical protein
VAESLNPRLPACQGCGSRGSDMSMNVQNSPIRGLACSAERTTGQPQRPQRSPGIERRSVGLRSRPRRRCVEPSSASPSPLSLVAAALPIRARPARWLPSASESPYGVWRGSRRR